MNLRSGEIAKKSLVLPRTEYSLTVKPTPAEAMVRIMNIRQVYEDGILLVAGRYDIEVSASGFDTWREWIDLEKDLELTIDLTASDAELLVESRPADANLKIFTQADDLKWEGKTGERVGLPPESYRIAVELANYDPFGQTVGLSAGEKRRLDVVLVPLAREEELAETEQTANFTLEHSWKSHDDAICQFTNCLAFSPDGKKLFSGFDFTVKLGDLSKENDAVILPSNLAIVNCFAVSPDQKWLAACSSKATIQIFNAFNGKKIRTLDGGSNSLRSVDFSPNAKWLASGSWTPDAVHVWATKDWRLKHTLSGHDYLTCVRFSPDGQVLAFGSRDNSVKLCSMSNGKLLYALEGHYAPVHGLAFSPDGKTLLSGSYDFLVKLWDSEKGRLLRTYKMRAGDGCALAVSPDGLLLAWGTRIGEIDLVRISDGQLMQILTGHGVGVMSVAFSPDGRYLASADEGGVIKLWRWQASPLSIRESQPR